MTGPVTSRIDTLSNVPVKPDVPKLIVCVVPAMIVSEYVPVAERAVPAVPPRESVIVPALRVIVYLML